MSSKNKEKFLHEKLAKDLAYLKLPKIQEIYQETLEYATNNNLSLSEVLCTLFGEEASSREERALLARLKRAKLPKCKTLEEYDFNFPTRIPKQKILSLFDCDFVEKNKNVIFIGPSGVGKSHLLTSLGYACAHKGISVRFVRLVDMINELSAAQANGTLGRALRSYVKPQALFCDEMGFLPVDKQGADLMFQVVAARYEHGSIIITTNRLCAAAHNV